MHARRRALFVFSAVLMICAKVSADDARSGFVQLTLRLRVASGLTSGPRQQAVNRESVVVSELQQVPFTVERRATRDSLWFTEMQPISLGDSRDTGSWTPGSSEVLTRTYVVP